MKKIVIGILLIFLLSSLPLKAEDLVNDLTSKINEYTAKLEELGKSKDTLANQIKILTSQAELTLLKITQTESNIKNTETEILDLSQKINVLDISLNELSSAYISQVTQNYKLPKRIPFLSILRAGNFNNFLTQYKYLAVIQKNSQDTLLSMETVRSNFDIQKAQKTQKQIELESLKKKLADQKDSLQKQKNSKANLLEVTKNNELKYQQLKKAAEDELNSLLKAKFIGKRHVKAGEPIGLMGNSGYSFGDHLHFGLYTLNESAVGSWTYQNDIDSASYIASHMWPMNEPITITQGRGQTKYSYLYADKFHHGIDMVSPNKTVRAVAEGEAYFYRNPGSSLGNHVKLFHPDGKMTLYLHLQ